MPTKSGATPLPVVVMEVVVPMDVAVRPLLVLTPLAPLRVVPALPRDACVSALTALHMLAVLELAVWMMLALTLLGTTL
jgi:hypothetical protein